MPDKIIATSEFEGPGHYEGPATFSPSSSAIASAFPSQAPGAPGANAIHPDDQIVVPEPVVYASIGGTMFGETDIQLHPHELEVLLHSDNVNHDSYTPANVPEPEVPLNQAPDRGPINNVPEINDNETIYHSPNMRPQHDGNNQ